MQLGIYLWYGLSVNHPGADLPLELQTPFFLCCAGQRLISETSPAEDEPAANFALCVSSLNAAQILDQMESIFALLNGC